MKIRWLWGLWLMGLPLVRAEPPLRIVTAAELSRCLPHKDLFENIEDRLFRSNDGRTVYLGPSPERRYFKISGYRKVEEGEAPTAGKVYPDSTGQVRIWMKELAEGVHYPEGFIYHPEDPVRTRFGVSLDAVATYTVFRDTSKVYRVDRPFQPVWSEEGFFIYRIGADQEKIVLVGYQRLQSKHVRKHLAIRLLKIQGVYQEMDRIELDDRVQALDIDMAGDRMLLMNDGSVLGQLFEVDLRNRKMEPRGTVEGFALYLSPDFLLADEGDEP